MQRIWITAKTRMESERRLRAMWLAANLATAWYSFLLVCVSVATLQGSEPKVLQYAAVFLSIFVLVATVFISGFRFDHTAELHRHCYLELQALEKSSLNPAEKTQRYDAILLKYPNHGISDYENMVVRAKLQGKELQNDQGEIKVTGWMLLGYLWRKIYSVILLLAIFAGPLLAGKFIIG